MKIAAGQIRCVLGQPSANLATIEESVCTAAAQGCDLIVLPEMSDTGYEMSAIAACASTWPGEPIDRLMSLAREHHIAIICGLSQRADDRVYNASVVVNAQGEVCGNYRKTHLFSLDPVCEDQHLGRGDSIAVVPIGDFHLGLMICYDIRFPELARCLALAGADLLVVIAAWPAKRIEHWVLLNKARAIENQAFVVAVNRVGTDADMHFGGQSVIIDPYGVPLATGSSRESQLIIATIDHGAVDKTRATMRIFDDRRPDLYGSLVQAP